MNTLLAKCYFKDFIHYMNEHNPTPEELLMISNVFIRIWPLLNTTEKLSILFLLDYNFRSN